MIDEQPIDPGIGRLLRRLAVPGAWLAQLDAASASEAESCPSSEPAYRLMSLDGGAKGGLIARRLVEGATQRGWVIDGDGRITLTPSGASSLRRFLSGGGDSAAPTERTAVPVRHGRQEPTAHAPGLNEAESPLGWLRRRKDKAGRSLIDDEQYAAGERLRADVYFAGLTASVTMDWSRSGGSAPSRRSAPGGSAQMLDNMVAARQRVDRAMRAVGPEMSGILLDVCGFMKGLESIEVEHGWPARSGKVILLKALSMLARHYGLTKPDRHPLGRDQRTPIRHWGADDYRPGTTDWEISGDDLPGEAPVGRPARATRH